MATSRNRNRTWTGKPADGPQETQSVTQPGSFLSDFALPDLSGGIVRISDQTGHPYILLFVSPDCQHSHKVLQEVARLRRKPHGARLPMVIVSSNGQTATAELADTYDLGNDVAWQERTEVMTFFRIDATPSAHEVDATRRTVGEIAVGSHDVIAMLRGKSSSSKATQRKPGGRNDSTPRPRRTRPKLAAGQRVPDIDLAAPEGFSISLAAQLGRRVLLIVWSSDCPACDQLLDQLQETAALNHDLGIVIVGRDGDRRPEGLPAFENVVFGTQERRSASNALGLHQAPSALLIDPDGRVIGSPASGIPDVSKLLASLR